MKNEKNEIELIEREERNENIETRSSDEQSNVHDCLNRE